MQPIKLSIYGDFFDTQIYSGKLYLWTFTGFFKKVSEILNGSNRHFPDKFFTIL